MQDGYLELITEFIIIRPGKVLRYVDKKVAQMRQNKY